ncbi:MAG: nuclear transport factor 2 family protein [Erysipelotrichaceae bacterium]|nr:nuclear transport factor 2 family protein [Erysipelotrichaceae bacterium]
MSENVFNPQGFFEAIVSQNAKALQQYFSGDAEIFWYNTNEVFSLSEYIRANCEYPGKWQGELEVSEFTGTKGLLIYRVFDEKIACRCVCFLTLKESLIRKMEEYWADITPPPSWRQEMKIGAPIKKSR